jgi:hypothetical protein
MKTVNNECPATGVSVGSTSRMTFCFYCGGTVAVINGEVAPHPVGEKKREELSSLLTKMRAK